MRPGVESPPSPAAFFALEGVVPEPGAMTGRCALECPMEWLARWVGRYQADAASASAQSWPCFRAPTAPGWHSAWRRAGLRRVAPLREGGLLCVW